MTSKQIVSLVFLSFVVLFGLSVVFGSFYQIDEGERGVLLRSGKYVSTSGPGLSWKLPIIETVEVLSVQDRKAEYQRIPAYSRDQQPASITFSVNYRMNPSEVGAIYANYGSEEAVLSRLINPQALEEMKTVFGRFTAVAAIQDRERLNLEVQAAISAAVDGPVTVDRVQIEDITFSQAYEQSIEQRMLAEVEVERIRQNLERERIQAEIVVTQAQAEADRTRLQGEAEAAAINARGEALRNNPDLVGLVQAEKWNGVLPTTMLPNQTLPILSVQ